MRNLRNNLIFLLIYIFFINSFKFIITYKYFIEKKLINFSNYKHKKPLKTILSTIK